MDAAVALGVKAVCGFVGRNISLDMDQNLEDYERSFVPLLKAAKDRGLEYRVEQCPMPGWNTTDLWHNQIGYTPGMWIRLHRIAEKHKVGDQLRIHYDPSHAILMGQNTRDVFQFLALVDKEGRVRKIYDSLKKEELEELEKDIGTLLKEKPSNPRFANSLFGNNPG